MLRIACLKIKFGEIKNLLDMLTQYEILEFCRLDWNRMKFYQTKTWDIMTENQISSNYRCIERLLKNLFWQIRLSLDIFDCRDFAFLSQSINTFCCWYILNRSIQAMRSRNWPLSLCCVPYNKAATGYLPLSYPLS